MVCVVCVVMFVCLFALRGEEWVFRFVCIPFPSLFFYNLPAHYCEFFLNFFLLQFGL